MNENQIELPANAAARRGFQLFVDLSGRGGSERIEVSSGEPFSLQAKVQVPPQAGKSVSVEWDFDGDGTFAPATFKTDKGTVVVRVDHRFESAGTYFPSIRVGSEREGDPTDTLTIIQNVDRVRVVVE